MRISTAAANQSALLDLLKSQRDQFEASQQLSTGKKAPDLKGYGRDVEAIMSARSTLIRTEGFIDGARRLENRLKVQDQALNQIADAAKDLRVAMTSSEVSFMMNDVQAIFDRVLGAVNTSFSGSYIFGGTRTDSKPFTGETIADLQGAAAIGDLFQNSGRKQVIQIEEGQTLDMGPLGSEIAEELFAIIERITDFDQGANGPFDGMPTPAQQTFLQTEIQNAIAVFDDITDLTATNGQLQQSVERQITTHIERVDYLRELISDFEDVDMAEAASRFTAAQNAVQVSAATFSQLSNLSLLPFLR